MRARRFALRFAVLACLTALAALAPSGPLVVGAQPPTTAPTAQPTTQPPTTQPPTTAPTPPPLVDITLEAMRAEHRTLSAERGHRAVILFYEDRPHLEDNATIKTELSRFIIDNQLGDRLVVYGVANLGDVGSVPHALVRQLIQPAVDRWDVEIMLDWDGAMRQPPFSFQTHAANTAVIDRDGHMIYSYTGTLDPDQRRVFYRALRQVIATR